MTSTTNLRPSQIKAKQLCEDIEVREYCRVLTIDIHNEQEHFKGTINKLLADGITILFEMFSERFKATTKSFKNDKELDWSKIINKARRYEKEAEIYFVDTKTNQKMSLVIYSRQVEIKNWEAAKKALYQQEPYNFFHFK